jgi:cytochrome c5
LATQCAACHDLRTVLLRPRTPADWVQTVTRMSEKPNPSGSLSLEAQNAVAAYLIAITPDLQASVALKKQQDIAQVSAPPNADTKLLFEQTCAQCHDAKLVEGFPLNNEQEARELVKRMVANGLKTDDATNERIIQYLKSTRVK